MHLQTILTFLPFVLLASAAPTRRNCKAKSKTSGSPDMVAALAANQDVTNPSGNPVKIPTGTGAVIPYIPETSLSISDSGVVAAWEKGGWGGWGKPKSTAVPPAPTNPPPPPPPPSNTAAPYVAPPPPSQPPVNPPALPNTPPTSAVPVAPPVSSPVAPPNTAVPVPSTPVTVPPAGGAGSGGKSGLALDDTAWQGLTNTPNLGWYWNWKIQPFQMKAEFVPCVWGEDMSKEFTGQVPAGSKYILSFNEPDMGPDVGGSLIPVDKAVTLHQAWTAKLTDPSIKIGAPAVARGGDVNWFTPWVNACAGNCKFEFIPIHFYGDNVQDMINYIKAFPANGKPMWLTEFDCQDFTTKHICEIEEQKVFMETAIAWFKGEGSAYIERWSWFGALPKFHDQKYGMVTKEGALNDLGTYYLGL